MSRPYSLSAVAAVLAFLCAESAKAELQYVGVITPPTELALERVYSTVSNGQRAQIGGGYFVRPARQYLENGSLGELEFLQSFDTSSLGGVAYGGNVVGSELVSVGYTGLETRAARWNAAGVPTPIGPAPASPDAFSYAFAIARNGTAVGTAGPYEGLTCCGWVSFPDGEVKTLPGVTPGVIDERGPRAITDDGKTIVGGAHIDRAMYWTIGPGNTIEAHNTFDPIFSTGQAPRECLEVASVGDETIALCTDTFRLAAFRLTPDRGELITEFGVRTYGGAAQLDGELLVGSSRFAARIVNGESFLYNVSDVRDLEGNVIVDLNAATGFENVELVVDGLFALGDHTLGFVFEGSPGLTGRVGNYVAVFRVVPEPGAMLLCLLGIVISVGARRRMS